MTSNREQQERPRWMSDAGLRRMIADQIRRRRAKRRRELAELECAIRRAEQLGEGRS